MKGLVILNGIILMTVIVIKVNFKKNISMPYIKNIRRFNIKNIPRNSKNQKGMYSINDRFGLLGDMLIFILYVFSWTVWQFIAISNSDDSIFRIWFLLVGIISAITIYVSIFENVVAEPADEKYKVVVSIPVYNEDSDSLMECLNSILRQTKKPDEIHIMDDGSSTCYYYLLERYKTLFEKEGVVFTWQYQVNSGKRIAQINALKNMQCSKENVIILTIDSDGVLSDTAIEEGIKPFRDRSVQSVAGVVVSKQVNKNLLSRIVDLYIVVQQQYERAALSCTGTVTVNSGALAFYRYEVIENAVNMKYLEETFLNKELKYSDDSYLTLVALSMGKTVTQRSAVSFADMPVSFNHHYRQQLRWMRGSFIRGMWRVKVAPINSITFIRQTFGWMSYFSSIYILVYVFINILLNQRYELLLQFSLPFMMLSYILNLKYLKNKRSDVSFQQQLATYALSPIAYLWTSWVIKTIKLIAFMSLAKNEWGTRMAVEGI